MTRIGLLEERLTGGASSHDELADRLGLLETAAASSADTRVDEILERLSAIESSRGAVAGAASTDLIKRVEGLEAVAALEAADTGNDPRVDGLLQRLDLIESASIAAGPDSVVEDITNRILAIEEKTEEAAPDPRVDELLARITSVEGRVEEAKPDPKTAELAQRLDALSEQVSLSAGSGGDAAAAELTERLNQLEQKLAAEPPPTDLTARLARLEEVATQNSQADLQDLLTEMAQKLDALERQVDEGVAVGSTGDGGSQKVALDIARTLGDRIAESLQGIAPTGADGRSIKSLESQMFGAYVWLGLASGVGLMAFLFLR